MSNSQYKAMWSGVLQVGMVPVHVSAIVGTQGDPNDGPLKRLCACCEQPFKRPSDVCPAGNHPESDAAISRGEENLTSVVYGVETGDDEYTVVDLDAVADTGQQKKRLDVSETVPIDDLPLHLAQGTYYLRPDRNVVGSAENFATLHSALVEAGLAVISQWMPRTLNKLVAIQPMGDALVMNLLPYRAQVREPDEGLLADSSLASDEYVEMMVTLLESIEEPFQYGKYVDESVAIRREAIDAALEGRELPAEAEVEKPTKAPDLMAQMKASIAAAKADKPKGKSKAKATA